MHFAWNSNCKVCSNEQLDQTWNSDCMENFIYRKYKQEQCAQQTVTASNLKKKETTGALNNTLFVEEVRKTATADERSTVRAVREKAPKQSVTSPKTSAGRDTSKMSSQKNTEADILSLHIHLVILKTNVINVQQKQMN